MNFKEKLTYEFNYITKLAKNPERLAQYLVSKVKTKLPSFDKLVPLFQGKKGIEIGGPSPIFGGKGYIPVYPLTQQIDGVNFSNNTVWENTIKHGMTYQTGAASVGYQYILDAIDLSPVPSDTYDFILSSHSLEHIANPVKALKEWLRVIKKGGAITLILPDSRYTFDHNRPITKLEHLIDDYNNQTTEEDFTHLDQILKLHDYKMDRDQSPEEFKQRALDNINNRCLHQHVYDIPLLIQLLKYLNVEVILTDASFPHHLTVIGIKQ